MKFIGNVMNKIDYFKSKGVVCVEMEGAAIAAVCKRKGLNYFTFYCS